MQRVERQKEHFWPIKVYPFFTNLEEEKCYGRCCSLGDMERQKPRSKRQKRGKLTCKLIINGSSSKLY